MENPVEVVSEEAEAAAATDSTLAVTPTRTDASKEMEPPTETTHQGDLTEQVDDDFGDFAAATPSDVVDAKDEQTDLKSDLNPNKIEESNNAKDEDFGEFESTSENNGIHVIDGSDKQQVSPPDALDDDPFAHLPTVATSNEGGVGEEVSNDETEVVENTVLCDLEQEERSSEETAVQFPTHSSKDSEAESKNGIGFDNGHVEALPESEDFGEFERPQENTIIPLVDSEEQKVAPVDAFDDPFAHLSTGEETSCVSNNADTEEGHAIISDIPGDILPNNGDEFYSTHPSNDNSENSASESDGVESETGHESSSPDNDAGYFSAVTDGDGAEQSNEEDIQMNEPSVSAETMIQESASTEEIAVNDSDHSGAESKVGTASIIEQPGAETSSSTDIDATTDITDRSEGDHIDAAVVESDVFGAFERVVENVEAQADTTEISDDIAATEVEVVEESDSPGLMKENAVAGEMIAAEGTVDSDDVDDDDFGDFGSFEKADSAATEAANDSEALDIGPPEDEPIGDDDFGSFEHAEATTSDEQGEAPQASVPQAENDEDDDFGDFGDFTDFSSDTPAQQENSINVSGVAVGSDENIGHPPAQPPATNLLDPIVNKAEIIFKEVFAKENIPSKDDQHASERIVVKVTSSLTELGAADISEDPSAWLIESISSVMRGIEHLDKSGPTAIVNESSDYPYGHFTVPVCGLPLTKVDISASRRLQQKKSQVGIAFTESQDYSVGASFSADTEPSVEPPPVRQQVAPQSAGTVVSLPPLRSDANTASQNGSGPVDASFADFQSSNDASQSSLSSHASGTESNGKKETLSSSAKQFLQQIPDLSFMLKPTLSLPKKS